MARETRELARVAVGVVALAASNGCLGGDLPPRPNDYAGDLTGGVDYYVSGGAAPSVLVFDGATNALLGTLSIPAASAANIAFTPDGRRLYVATNDGPGADDVVVIDTDPSSPTRYAVIAAIDLNAVSRAPSAGAIWIEPEGRLAFLSNDWILDIDPCSPTYHHLLGEVTGLSATVAACAFAPPAVARQMWCAEAGPYGQPSAVAIVDMDPAASTTFAKATEVPLPDGYNPQGISVSPDGNNVYIASWATTHVMRVMNRAFPEIPTLSSDILGGTTFGMRGTAITNDAAYLYAVTDGPAGLRKYDLAADAFLNEVKFDATSNGMHAVALSLDGTTAYLSGTNTDVVRVVDLRPRTPVLMTQVHVTTQSSSGVAVHPEVPPTPRVCP